MRFRFLLVLLILLIAIVTITPVSAQTPPPEMTLEMPWEEWLVIPGWIEIQVTLTNENSNWEGELRLLDANNEITYIQSLVLPAHSRKFYRIPVYAPRAFTLRTALYNTGGTAESVQDITLYGIGERRLCAVADTTGMIKAQMLKECGVTLLIQDLAKLPETPMAWDAISVVVLNGVSTADLTPEQQEALLAWVSTGGRLILSGGAALPQTLAGLPQSLQIAAPGNTQVFDGLNLSGQEFNGVSAGALSLSASATPLFTSHGTCLAAQQILGQGEVNIISWDIVQTPSLEWLQTLWIADPVPAVQVPMAQNTSTSYGAPPLAYSLLQVPQKTLPGLRRWMMMLPIYILIVGPGTWFIVRRLRKPSLAWAIIPGWIVISLIVLSLMLNGQFSQMFPLTHQVAHIYVPGNDLPARVAQGAVMYAPRAQKLSWEMDGDSRWLLGNYTFDNSYYGDGEAYPFEVHYQENADRMEATRTLGVITWGTDGVTTVPHITADFQIKVEERRRPMLVGTLQSEMPLSEVSLFMGNGRYVVELTEDLAQGVILDVNQPMTQTEPTYTNYNRVCRGSNYLNSYAMIPLYASTTPAGLYTERSNKKPCYVAGMTKDVPFPVLDPRGTHLVESCILYAVPCPVQAHGDMEVPLQAVTDQTEDGWIDDAGTVYISAGGTTVPFVIPAYLQLQNTHSLVIKIAPPSWENDPSFDPRTSVKSLLLWDWAKEDWVEQPVPEDSKGLTLTGEEAERFYSNEAGVKVRIRPQDTSGTNVSLSLSIKGNW
ncbi:MAG: DUF4350 domain-containing protein [Anaerolineae bacterium]|nr:DUF4350 domain-containing protein [Anaerolineae bacterium]